MRTYKTSRLAMTFFAGALIFAPAAQADAVLDWNAIMQSTVAAQAPFPQARFAAITQLAVFEAVNAITKQYKPYLSTGTITPPRAGLTLRRWPRHTCAKEPFPTGAAMLMPRAVRSRQFRRAGQKRGHRCRETAARQVSGAERWILAGRVPSSDIVKRANGKRRRAARLRGSILSMAERDRSGCEAAINWMNQALKACDTGGLQRGHVRGHANSTAWPQTGPTLRAIMPSCPL